MDVAPDLRISSAVSTKTEAGDLEISCALRPTDVTCTLNNSSTPTMVKSSVGAPTRCAGAMAGKPTANNRRQRPFMHPLSAGSRAIGAMATAFTTARDVRFPIYTAV